jgi:phosphoglycolate phosphatase-like HAD superfamily hydrolase
VRRLVLWDIDGTLVDTARLGRQAFSDAFETLYGRPPEALVSFAGRTDKEIALDVLDQSGISNAGDELERFELALADALAGKQELIRQRGRPCPGAQETLARLADEPGIVQSVLTGNIEANAPIKLGAFGLAEHLDLEIGGYGSDHATRSELVAVARRKTLAKHGIDFAPADTVVIGDTPLDVAAAQTAGARAIGVAFGPFDADELREAGAEIVFQDLRDVDGLIRAIADGAAPPS